MQNYNWYQTLIRPSWAPPAWLFAPVWTALYAIIFVSYGSVIHLFATKRVPFIVLLPFLLNIGFNLAFTPIQFGLKNNTLALIDIMLVLGTLIWAFIAIWPHAKWVAIANMPYLAWVVFATILQITITILNR